MEVIVFMPRENQRSRTVSPVRRLDTNLIILLNNIKYTCCPTRGSVETSGNYSRLSGSVAQWKLVETTRGSVETTRGSVETWKLVETTRGSVETTRGSVETWKLLVAQWKRGN
ncbi:hypothetical protein CDAR_26961 [Caerostris darwini]|uniref:Uncharacterized protein n=1 Tax=Caerostris darwini TaxID=1538125 RepID=A0AAV4THK0_9ARAC|nr:hypothetical protein CDAR_26961 [Caerostris darwini]